MTEKTIKGKISGSRARPQDKPIYPIREQSRSNIWTTRNRRCRPARGRWLHPRTGEPVRLQTNPRHMAAMRRLSGGHYQESINIAACDLSNSLNVNTLDTVVLNKALLRVLNKIKIKIPGAAKILGVSQSFITKLKNGEEKIYPTDKSWEFAINLIQLYADLNTITAGDDDALVDWMDSYNQDLNGVPMELVETVNGLVETMNYVDRHRAII